MSLAVRFIQDCCCLRCYWWGFGMTGWAMKLLRIWRIQTCMSCGFLNWHERTMIPRSLRFVTFQDAANQSKSLGRIIDGSEPANEKSAMFVMWSNVHWVAKSAGLIQKSWGTLAWTKHMPSIFCNRWLITWKGCLFCWLKVSNYGLVVPFNQKMAAKCCYFLDM